MSITSKISNGFKTIGSGLQKVDSVLNIYQSAKDVCESKKANNPLGCAQSSVEFTKNSITGANYAVKGAQKSIGYAQLLPLGIDPNVTHFLHSTPVTQTLGGLGLLTSTLGLISNSISIYGQEKTLGCLYDLPDKHVEEKEKEQLTKCLENLRKLNYHQFLQSLPEYLKNDLKEREKSGELIFKGLIEGIRNDQPANAHKVAQEIKTGALKKEIFHLVSIVGCILGITASIALILGCPLVGLMILSIVGIALTLTAVLMKRGWVENPKEGFNWKLCFPEFLQKKLHVDKEIQTEMPDADSFIASKLHQNLDRSTHQQFPHFQTSELNYNDPKVQEQLAIFTSAEPKTVDKAVLIAEKDVSGESGIELSQRYPSTYQGLRESSSEKFPQSTVNPKNVSVLLQQEPPKKKSFWKKLIPGFLNRKEKLD